MRFSGKIALIANPAAQSGRGFAAAHRAFDFFERELGACVCELMFTEAPGHASDIVASLDPSFQTVVALGGDGAVHEIANGIMGLSPHARPILGVIPIGSGNDYAATLGMSGVVDRAVRQILRGSSTMADVGCVNGSYFVETLSFGMDAAIAIDTIERRKKTGRAGTALYLESGIDQLLHHLKTHRYRAVLEGGPCADPVVVDGESFLFAVQLGPTYGSRFKVCPDARIDDGLFDICMAHPPLGVARATGIFLLAKGGFHTRFRQIELMRASRLEIAFDEEPPAQVDGEPLSGSRFEVTCLPRALEVICAPPR